MTLDDVSCLLHLPIDGMLLSHESMTWDEAVEMMIQHLGADPGDDDQIHFFFNTVHFTVVYIVISALTILQVFPFKNQINNGTDINIYIRLE